jgi:hypothetical protein
MEIHRLSVSLSEKFLFDVAQQHLLEEVAIEDLEIRVLEEGVRVKGAYQMFVPVSFEALWQLGVEGGRVTAKLMHFRTLGMPANLLKSLIMNVIADAARQESWLHVQGDTLQADVDGMLKKHGLHGRTHLTAVRCDVGMVIVEAGNGELPLPGKAPAPS